MAYLGDAVLSHVQIHKIADSIFDTITIFSNDSTDFLTHSECAQRLTLEPIIQRVAFNRLPNPRKIQQGSKGQRNKKRSYEKDIAELFERQDKKCRAPGATASVEQPASSMSSKSRVAALADAMSTMTSTTGFLSQGISYLIPPSPTTASKPKLNVDETPLPDYYNLFLGSNSRASTDQSSGILTPLAQLRVGHPSFSYYG